MSQPPVSVKTSSASAAKKTASRRDMLLALALGVSALAGEFGLWYVLAGRDTTVVILLGVLLAAVIVPLIVREAYVRWRMERILRQRDPAR